MIASDSVSSLSNGYRQGGIAVLLIDGEGNKGGGRAWESNPPKIAGNLFRI